MIQIVFIDAAVVDASSIIATLPLDADYYLLRADEDGVDQIAAILASYQELGAIHVFSHGSAGYLRLGNTVLDQESLAGYSSKLSAISASLVAGGDLLLYGCNVAAGSVGADFIGQLASLAGADVAASSDLTGAAILGGECIWKQASGSSIR